MKPEEQRDIMLLVAAAELAGGPVSPWAAHAALLRARSLAEKYANSDHPERTAASVNSEPGMEKQMNTLLENGIAYCLECEKSLELRWESRDRRWMARAMALAKELHKRESPDCPGTTIEIRPCPARAT